MSPRGVGTTELTRELLGTEDYEYKCAAAGIPPTDQGWTLLHFLDGDRRFTEIKDNAVPLSLNDQRIKEGWPDEWFVVSQKKPCPCGSGRKYKHCHGNRRAKG